MISKYFIERPVLANVLAILMMVIGGVALFSLPVAQYPDVTPPTVQVQTRYPGASARTLIDTVALPIEQQVNGVENMIYMQSTSTSDGAYTLIVTFRIGTDLNFAQVLVQNRVSAALSSLPDAVQSGGRHLEGWPRVRSPLPSFETRPAGAPQDEGWWWRSSHFAAPAFAAVCVFGSTFCPGIARSMPETTTRSSGFSPLSITVISPTTGRPRPCAAPPCSRR